MYASRYDATMTLSPHPEAVLALVVAAMLSGAVGWEREWRSRPAGLRTHMLVGVGAALLTWISVHSFEGGGDRIAANIVTGVGFLGAGVIIRRKHTVHDLTTAATVWVVAALGIACGVGEIGLAVTGWVVVMLVLIVLRAVEPMVAPGPPPE